MARPSKLVIDLEAIRNNYRVLRSLSLYGQTLAVVKANAYGHGAVPVCSAIEPEADGFAVACIEEAIELREAGIGKPILLLEGFFERSELALIKLYNLWPVIHSQYQLEMLLKADFVQPLKVWLKLDTGMHRLGFGPSEYRQAYQRLKSSKLFSDIVMMSHMAAAEDQDADSNIHQLQRFAEMQLDCPSETSIANSAGIMCHRAFHMDWQRAGIALYGTRPCDNISSMNSANALRPAMSMISKVIAVRVIQEGEGVGYNSAWVAKRTTRVGTVAVGYADGYPRQAKNGTPILVNGTRTQVIGRVSMDMLTVDLSGLDAGVGADVELWGKTLPAIEVASYCDTIPYHLFTGVGNRLHREIRACQIENK